jgi:hypothetical protein
MRSACWLWVVAVLSCLAADPKQPDTNVIRQIDANTLQIGAVRIEAKEKRLIIPATVNMVEGPIEYVLVSATGKLHESIFKTTAEPVHIQTAALLLLKTPALTNRPPLVRVQVELSPTNSRAAEELIENTKPDARLAPGSWRYNGSRIVDGTFIAQRDGSIISIIADPDTLIESGRVAADDDENWRPKKTNLPPVGTAVKVVLAFNVEMEVDRGRKVGSPHGSEK